MIDKSFLAYSILQFHFHRLKSGNPKSNDVPQQPTPNNEPKEDTVKLGYWNVQGFNHQSAWAVERALESKVVAYNNSSPSSVFVPFKTF